MSRSVIVAAALVVAAMVAPTSAFSLRGGDVDPVFSHALGLTGDESTNICNLDWNYCPRDPGCITYTMSVHTVTVSEARRGCSAAP